MSSYFDSLYTASWRGMTFVTREAEGEFGRKTAVHNYTKRDTVYVEDMGRKARSYSVSGFLVGDDVLAQRDYLISLCEIPGPGLLIHPTHGIVNVSLISFTESSRVENGRVVDIHFQFMEAGAKLFPSIVANTFGAISTAINNVFGAGTADFISNAASAVTTGASVVAAGAQAISTWTAAGNALVKGATNLFGLSSSMQGNFGRFAGGATGANSTSSVSNSVGTIATQVSGLIAQGASARAAVAASGQSLFSTVEGL